MLVQRLFLPCLTALILSGAFITAAQTQPPAAPLWTHAFDLSVRKLKEDTFTDKTQKFGVEAFKDTNNGVGIYCSQVGSIAATPSGFTAFTGPIPKSKGPSFIAGIDLPVRKAGQKSFEGAERFAMEIFRDQNTENWVFITDKGMLAVTPAKGPKVANKNPPTLSHSVDLQVRKGGTKEWKDAKKIGVEVYLEKSTGCLVYITDTGAMAVIAEDPAKKATGNKDPDWQYGLDLKSRKSNETEFKKDTKTIGVEVYQDTINGNIIYITETGNIAVAIPSKAFKKENLRDPARTHAFNIKARKVGESDFSAATQQFGVEVFRDENVGLTLYLAETGSLTAVKLP